MTSCLVVLLVLAVLVVAALWFGYFEMPAVVRQLQSNSEASEVGEMIGQVSSAAELYRSDSGKPVIARTPAFQLQQYGFLKQMPSNPMLGDGGWPIRFLYSKDLLSSGYYADMVFVSLGPSNEARRICKDMNRQANGEPVMRELNIGSGADVSLALAGQAGCFRMNDIGVNGEVNPHDYVAYRRL